MTVEWKDMGLEKAIANMSRSTEPDLSIGVHLDAKSRRDDGKMPVEMAFIAAVHEFGAKSANVPERSFLRSTMADESGHMIEAFGKIVEQSIKNGSDPSRGLKILGQYAVSRVKQKIKSRIPPPLSAATLANKGPKTPTRRRKGDTKKRASVPLVDTGQLINSITYKVIG